MIRSLFVFIASAALMAAPVFAEHHSRGDHHHNGHQPSACCFHIDGQTAEVLIAPGSDAVRRIQAELAVKGFNPGPIDGILGPRTQSALRAFQRREGLYEGLLTTETLSRLGIQVRRQAADAPHHLGDLAGSTRSKQRIVTVNRVEPSTTTIVRRERAMTIIQPPPAPERLPNYIGRRGEHRVEALTWSDKAER